MASVSTNGIRSSTITQLRLHDGLPFVAMRGTDWQPVEAPKIRIALASSVSLNVRDRIPTELVENIVVDFGRLFNRSTLNQAPGGGVLAGSSAASSSTTQLGPNVQTSLHITQSTNTPEDTVGYIFNEATTALVTVYHYDFRGRRIIGWSGNPTCYRPQPAPINVDGAQFACPACGE